MAFTIIETQEQLDAIVGDRVARAKESARKEFEGWISPEDLTKKTDDLTKQLNGLADQVKTLTDEKSALETQLTEKDGKIAKYETDSVKTKIAREYGLSYEAVDFLQGEDEEAIKKSAETLKALVGQRTEPLGNPELPPGGSGDSKDAALREMLSNIKGE